MIISVNLKVMQGDKVNVLNYRCKPVKWESGEVTRVEAHIFDDGQSWIKYTVRLDRKIASKKIEGYQKSLEVTVSNDGITKIN
jgi:hypothetical protein